MGLPSLAIFFALIRLFTTAVAAMNLAAWLKNKCCTRNYKRVPDGDSTIAGPLKSYNNKTQIDKDEFAVYAMTYDAIDEGFCFLKVLTANEARQFVDELKNHYEEDLVDIYNTRGIKTSVWFAIMRKIRLERSYRVYRRAYCGENFHIETISSKKTTMVCYLSSFYKVIDESNEQNLDKLDYFVYKLSGMSMSRDLYTVNLVITDNHICVLECLQLSNWANPYYELDATESFV